MAMFNINMIGQVIPLGCVRHCADCLDIKNIIDRDLRFSPERSHRQPPDTKLLEAGREKNRRSNHRYEYHMRLPRHLPGRHLR